MSDFDNTIRWHEIKMEYIKLVEKYNILLNFIKSLTEIDTLQSTLDIAKDEILSYQVKKLLEKIGELHGNQ